MVGVAEMSNLKERVDEALRYSVSCVLPPELLVLQGLCLQGPPRPPPQELSLPPEGLESGPPPTAATGTLAAHWLP